MHGRPTQCLSFCLNVCPDAWVGGGHVVQTFKQSFEVQHGATYQQGHFAPRSDVIHTSQCVSCKLSRTVGGQWIANINQVVLDCCQFCRRGFGRADVHAFVN